MFDFAHKDSSKHIDCTDMDLLDVDLDRSNNDGMLKASVNMGGGGRVPRAGCGDGAGLMSSEDLGVDKLKAPPSPMD